MNSIEENFYIEKAYKYRIYPIKEQMEWLEEYVTVRPRPLRV